MQCDGPVRPDYSKEAGRPCGERLGATHFHRVAAANDPKQTSAPDCRMLDEWQNLVLRLRLFFRRDLTGHGCGRRDIVFRRPPGAQEGQLVFR